MSTNRSSKGASGLAQISCDPRLLEDLVVANRILFHQGVVDAFGHVSVRHDRHKDRFLLARNLAPALVTEADILEFNLQSEALMPDAPPVYLERFIHAEIYRARPDVSAVVHSHSPSIIPFSVAREARLRPVCHVSAFLGTMAEGVPMFEIRNAAGPASDMLVRNPQLGQALAQTLGDSPVVLMRGHGSTSVGSDLRQAVYRAVYTEVNARLQAEAMRMGEVIYLNPEESVNASAANDSQLARAWDFWKMRANGDL